MPYDGFKYTPDDEAVRLLDRVVTIIPTPDRWCQGKLNDDAGRHCLMGAVMVADAGSVHLEWTSTNVARATIFKTLTALAGENPAIFNNRPETTHADVLRLIADARAALVAENAGTAVAICP
jgi:hypothetical protein